MTSHERRSTSCTYADVVYFTIYAQTRSVPPVRRVWRKNEKENRVSWLAIYFRFPRADWPWRFIQTFILASRRGNWKCLKADTYLWQYASNVQTWCRSYLQCRSMWNTRTTCRAFVRFSLTDRIISQRCEISVLRGRFHRPVPSQWRNESLKVDSGGTCLRRAVALERNPETTLSTS